MSKTSFSYSRRLLHSGLVVFQACTGYQAVTDVMAEKERKVTREARERLGPRDLLVEMGTVTVTPKALFA